MRVSIRAATLTVIPAAIALAPVLVRPLPALADATVTSVPGTVVAGESTTVTAGCGSNATSARLSATSFGGPSRIVMTKD